MEQLGKYQLVRRIGTGGMAEVFLARTALAQGLNKQLVIKKIHPAFARSRQFVSMFIDEAKIALGLNHPNIVQVFDFGPAGDTYFLAMEYVEGVDLLRLGQLAAEQGKQIPAGLAAYVVQQLCKGLDYAHRKTDDYGEPLGIVHRDISQQNILVSWDGSVKIVDFGIARARGVHEEEGVIKGKFAYMSPEQARGDVVDSRSDVYSAGVVLFEMLCNRPLYTGKGKDLLEKVKTGALPRPRYINPGISKELEGLVLQALAYHRDDRFQTARDMQYAMSKLQLQLAQDTGVLLDSAALAQFVAQVVPAEQRKPPPLPPSAEGTPASLRMRDGDTGGSLEDTDARRISGASTPAPVTSTRERKHVYVLEGSICGLPNLERRVGADRAAAMVDDYLEVAKNIGFKHDAQLHRIDEAGVTFVVGLPLAAEDDASRAIRLALALVDALDGIGHDVEPELRLAVGIQSGMATLKREGSSKLAYDLSPATTAIARRLSREAQGAEVLVGGRVFRVAKGDFTFEEMTTIDVPADPDTQPDAKEEGPAKARIYRLRGPKERAERLRERARGQLRLLGRELELKTLRDIYRDVLMSRRKRQVLIAADVGMGKRSLVQAFLEGVPAGEALIIRAAARVATAFTPYGVLVNLARDLLGLADGASPAEVTRRVERAAALLYPTEQDAREVRGLVQMVCMLLGGQVPEDVGNIDPAERRQRLLEAMRKVESRLGADKPLIVIGEDMHWADDETQDLFRELLKMPTPRPILGIVTARPEARVLDAAKDTFADVIRLEELGDEERLAMVVREFVPGEDVETLAREVVERAGGNPFFIREVLDSLIERGIAVADPEDGDHPGLLRWVRRDALVQVPTSVEALLAARMDRLPQAEKDTLLRAAVLGRQVSIDQLQALLGRNPAAELEALEGRGLIRRTGDRLAFRNDMTMTVAYGLLPADERGRLHRQAAAQIGGSAGFRAGQDDPVIARHLELAGDASAAADRYLSAAGHAVEVGGSADAFRLLTRALKLLPADDHARRFHARRQREDILGRMARRGEQLREIHNMRKEAEALADAGKQALAHCRLAQFYIDVGKAPAASRAVGPALEHARAAGDKLAEADALRLRAAISRLVGNNEESLALSEEALALCGDDKPGLLGRATILNNRGTTLWNMGRLVQASESYAEALVIYRALGLPRQEARALNNMGIIFAALGEFEEALAHYKSSLKIDQELGDRASIALKLGNIGQAYSDLGDLERGERYLTKALKIAEGTEESTSVVDAAISLGQLHLQAGRPREALALLERGLSLATEFRDRYQEIRALIYIGLGQLDAGDPPEGALELTRSATELARKSTMAIGEVYGLCAQGLALSKLGRASEGLELTTQAVALLDKHKETEGAELVLHMHARLCLQNGRTVDAASALRAAWTEVQSKAARLRDPELREIYLRSKVPAEIAAARGRLESP